VGKGIVTPSQDGSFQYRNRRLVAGWQVFTHNPVVGAGPGAAGAYFVDHLIETADTGGAIDMPANYPTLRRDPLSQNLYTEVLSEWGLLGFIALFAGLWFLFARLHGMDRWQALAVLGVVYLSTQTLPRFDLWATIGLIAALAL
jgi:O-antigen ligase